MMKKILIFLLGLIFCGQMWAATDSTILVVGDSLSAGYGIDVQKGWVNLLSQRLQQQGYPYTVVNSSISGDTTSNGLLRLPVALKEHHPAIVVLELGANDGLRGMPLKTIEKNLSEMIDLCLQQKAKVLLVGLRIPSNYGWLYTKRFHDIYSDLADDKDVPLVPYFLEGMDENMSLFQQDTYHPNEDAQPILLDNVWKELKGMLEK